MAFDPKAIRILLVEDTAVMRKIETKTLRNLGFTSIVEAADGKEAVALLQEGRSADLVISDWNMPQMDGLALLRWIRASAAHGDLPFLMATGQSDKAQEKKAVAAGVSAFVAKPFNEGELKLKIEEALGLAAAGGTDAPQARGPREVVDGRVKLKVAHIQITDHIILGVLKHLIHKGDLKPQHFVLETVCLPGWNPVQQALETGAVDAAFILAPIAMDLYSFGVPIKLVLLAHKNGSICVRSSQAPLIAPEAEFFRGKSFLLPHKMSVHHMLAHLFFSRIGLKPGMVGEGQSDVNFEIVAPIKMQDFLAHNPNAAGFMVAEPLGTRAIAAGAAELQFLSSELWENHPCCVVALRDDFIEPHAAAVYELTAMLVQAGKFVAQKPEMAAEIGVAFLDPDKALGLKVPVLRNVLTEAQGIKTGDLYPALDDLKAMNDYMVKRMRIGRAVDMGAFVDTRFADAACRDRVSSNLRSNLHIADARAEELLRGKAEGQGPGAKAMLNLEGKYLTFVLDGRQFGMDILRIREIIGLAPIRTVPQAPASIKGVISLRGQVIPVMDLRRRFGIGPTASSDRNCIIVVDARIGGALVPMGIAVDAVSEVCAIKSAEIEPTPFFGSHVDARHIAAIASLKDGLRMLLNLDHVIGDDAALAAWSPVVDAA
jgi:chemotaxis signal transduction protein/CheY-like chemotaxis protein